MTRRRRRPHHARDSSGVPAVPVMLRINAFGQPGGHFKAGRIGGECLRPGDLV